jgi:hypothetical protein
MSNIGSYEESVKDFTWEVSEAGLGYKMVGIAQPLFSAFGGESFFTRLEDDE